MAPHHAMLPQGVSVLLACALVLALVQLAAHVSAQAPEVWSYEIVAQFPHDSGAFTQGIQFDRLCNDTCKTCYDVFWESTGLNGRSSVRLVELSSGAVQRKTDMGAQHFAEGLARLGDRLYQITWRTGDGFIYSIPDLKQVGKFKTELGDGWGLTTDGKHLIATESSPTVHFIDPTTFKTVKSYQVMDGTQAVKWVNELELVRGELWGNIWQTECIVRIELATGKVLGYIMMHGLREKLIRQNPAGTHQMDVLNGIAWDNSTDRVFVTGKLWPALFEVKVVPHPKPPALATVQSRCWAR